jgi:hypothetical protein
MFFQQETYLNVPQFRVHEDVALVPDITRSLLKEFEPRGIDFASAINDPFDRPMVVRCFVDKLVAASSRSRRRVGSIRRDSPPSTTPSERTRCTRSERTAK